MSGDTDALNALHDDLARLKEQKKLLLLDSGFPADYLDPVFSCPDCQDTGYINREKCHCFRQAEISLLYEQSGIQDLLAQNNFELLSYDYYTGEALVLFQNAVKTFHTKNRDERQNAYADLYRCDLLIIDDLGTELTNQFTASQLFSLLNERHLGKKSTLISTNFTLAQLRDRYSDRIFSRITSNFDVCRLAGEDIRMYKLQ